MNINRGTKRKHSPIIFNDDNSFCNPKPLKLNKDIYLDKQKEIVAVAEVKPISIHSSSFNVLATDRVHYQYPTFVSSENDVFSNDAKRFESKSNTIFDHPVYHNGSCQIHATPEMNDFRAIPVCPRYFETLNRRFPRLPDNNIKQPYESVDQYLNIQFRLIREDFMRPLRDGIAEYKAMVHQNRADGFANISNVYVYKNVQLLSSQVTRSGDLIHSAKFDTKKLGRIQWSVRKIWRLDELIEKKKRMRKK